VPASTAAAGAHDSEADAPGDHEAHQRVRLDKKKNLACCLIPRPAGQVRLQVTGTGIGLETAARICRVCCQRLLDDPAFGKKEAEDLKKEHLAAVKKHRATAQRSDAATDAAAQLDPDERPLAEAAVVSEPALHRPSSSKAVGGPNKVVPKVVPSKAEFLCSALPWQVTLPGSSSAEPHVAAPFHFSRRGTLGWFLQCDVQLPFQGGLLTCKMHVQGTVFNSARWPEGGHVDASASGAAASAHAHAANPVAEEDEDGAADLRGSAGSAAPPQIARILGSEDWQEQWLRHAGVVPLSVGPWGRIELTPQVYRRHLGWKGREMKGRPVSNLGAKLVGNGGLPIFDGDSFQAPSQVHIWLRVLGSRQWLAEAAGGEQAEEIEQAVEAASACSEDCAEQAELEEEVAHMLAAADPGAAVRCVEATGAAETEEASEHVSEAAQDQEFRADSYEAIGSESDNEPLLHELRAESREATDSESDNEPQGGRRAQVRSLPQQPRLRSREGPQRVVRSSVALWHRWFKSMNADTFFTRLSQDPAHLHTYTEMMAKREELLDAPADRAVTKTARLLKEQVERFHYERPCRVADLGCGSADLAREVAMMHWQGQPPEVTSVDAVQFAPEVLTHNIAALPREWEGYFDAVVLCRSLWSRDYMRVLMEARRILRPDHKARLLVVEPFRRWWGRDKRRSQENALPWFIQRAGFSITWALSTGTEPSAAKDGGALQHSLFQFVAAQLEPTRCVVCAKMPGHQQRTKGFRLCLNCEVSDVGSRPVQGQEVEASACSRSASRLQSRSPAGRRRRVSLHPRRRDRRSPQRHRSMRSRSRQRRSSSHSRQRKSRSRSRQRWSRPQRQQRRSRSHSDRHSWEPRGRRPDTWPLPIGAAPPQGRPPTETQLAQSPGVQGRMGQPPRLTICKFWLRDRCKRGRNCLFSHNPNNREPERPGLPFRAVYRPCSRAVDR